VASCNITLAGGIQKGFETYDCSVYQMGPRELLNAFLALRIATYKIKLEVYEAEKDNWRAHKTPGGVFETLMAILNYSELYLPLA